MSDLFHWDFPDSPEVSFSRSFSMRKGKIEKALKPSQRKSITEFSSQFGNGISFEEKERRKKLFVAISIALCIIFLIFIGYLITETLIQITELPASINLSEASVSWISSHITLP